MKAQTTDRTERRGIGIATETFESLGFAFRNQLENDYGIDAHAELIQSEQATGQILGIQLKSGPSYFSEPEKTGFVFRTDEKHVNYWCDHALPVLICLCDVDTRDIYWQLVSRETAISTGKGYKIIVPSTQRLNSLSVETLQTMLTPIVPATRYTIFEEDDVSVGAAKRLRFAVVLNGTATKSEIAAIVRQVTQKGMKRRYSRYHIFNGRDIDSDTQVIGMFIYPTPEDYQSALWICRSTWIDSKLAEQFRPVGFQGENIGDDIIVDWNAKYHEWSQFYSEHIGSKADYLSAIVPMAEELENLFGKTVGFLNRYNSKDISEEEFISLTGDDLKRVEEIYRASRYLPFSAPFECREVNRNYQSFIALLDNVRLYYDEESRDTWSKENRLYLSIKACQSALEKLKNFKYELSKIR